ncbi:MAG: hypothetical protein ACKPKO_51475, partial [Candidatus Fonsibacter sp.]
NLRLVVRDKPHNDWRILQRTLPKYRFFCTLMTKLLWSRGSLAKLAQHSPQHHETFRRHQARHAANGRIPILNKLSYAEHRFDLIAKPLGRISCTLMRWCKQQLT